MNISQYSSLRLQDTDPSKILSEVPLPYSNRGLNKLFKEINSQKRTRSIHLLFAVLKKQIRQNTYSSFKSLKCNKNIIEYHKLSIDIEIIRRFNLIKNRLKRVQDEFVCFSFAKIKEKSQGVQLAQNFDKHQLRYFLKSCSLIAQAKQFKQVMENKRPNQVKLVTRQMRARLLMLRTEQIMTKKSVPIQLWKAFRKWSIETIGFVLTREVSKQESILGGEKRKAISIFANVINQNLLSVLNKIKISHAKLEQNEEHFHSKLRFNCFHKVLSKIFVKRTATKFINISILNNTMDPVQQFLQSQGFAKLKQRVRKLDQLSIFKGSLRFFDQIKVIHSQKKRFIFEQIRKIKEQKFQAYAKTIAQGLIKLKNACIGKQALGVLKSSFTQLQRNHFKFQYINETINSYSFKYQQFALKRQNTRTQQMKLDKLTWCYNMICERKVHLRRFLLRWSEQSKKVSAYFRKLGQRSYENYLQRQQAAKILAFSLKRIQKVKTKQSLLPISFNNLYDHSQDIKSANISHKKQIPTIPDYQYHSHTSTIDNYNSRSTSADTAELHISHSLPQCSPSKIDQVGEQSLYFSTKSEAPEKYDTSKYPTILQQLAFQNQVYEEEHYARLGVLQATRLKQKLVSLQASEQKRIDYNKNKLRQVLQQWANNLTFENSKIRDYDSYLTILQNEEKELNSEVQEAKKEFLSSLRVKTTNNLQPKMVQSMNKKLAQQCDLQNEKDNKKEMAYLEFFERVNSEMLQKLELFNPEQECPEIVESARSNISQKLKRSRSFDFRR